MLSTAWCQKFLSYVKHSQIWSCHQCSIHTNVTQCIALAMRQADAINSELTLVVQ